MKLKNCQSGFAHPVAIGAIAVVLVVVGFAGYRVVASNNKKPVNSTEQHVKTEDKLPVDLNGVLEVSKVKELAIGSSSTSVRDLELESEHGQLVYKVTLSDGSVVVLDAKTGAKVANNDAKAEVENGDDALPADFTVSISFEKAREIAQAKFPNGTINKIELDVEGGKVVLSVRFADRARVDVDASTGAIVRTKDPRAAKPTESSSSQQSSSTPSTPATTQSGSTSGSGGGSGSGSSGSGSSGSGTSSSNSGSGSTSSGSGSSGSSGGSSSSDDDSDDSHHGGSDDDSSGSHSGSGSRH